MASEPCDAMMSESQAGELVNSIEMDSPDYSRTDLPTPVPENDIRVRLQIGEREFITTRETLKESGYFTSLLARNTPRWGEEVLRDGTFYLDGDGDLFEHILRYLRRGVLPLFYDKEKGHDYAMYGAILQEARFYQIEKLRKWIESKKYLEVVTVNITTSSYGHTSELGNKVLLEDNVGADVEIQQIHQWTTAKRYICPAKVPGKVPCDMSCLGPGPGQTKAHTEIETETFHQLQVIQVKKEIVFNYDLCLGQ